MQKTPLTLLFACTIFLSESLSFAKQASPPAHQAQEISISNTSALPSNSGFTGDWLTSYGNMKLEVHGNTVRGTYQLGSEICQVDGTISGQEMVFKYTEPTARGRGRFTLASDGLSFSGKWLPEGSKEWRPWEGRRVSIGTSELGTSELFRSIVENISIPIEKEPQNGMFGLCGGSDIAKGKITYPGWSDDEILRYHLKGARWSLEKHGTLKNINFIGWMELLQEAYPQIEKLPASFSNRQRWEENGLLTRNQTRTGCNWYSTATALDAVLINKGYKNPNVDVATLEKRGDSKLHVNFAPIRALTVAPIGISRDKKLDFKGITIRSLGLVPTVNHVEFPNWLRRKMQSEGTLLGSEWRIIDQELIKYEIAHGRPVKLAIPFPLPNAKGLAMHANPDNKNEIIIESCLPGVEYPHHAVILTGYKPNPKHPDFTLFEFINSSKPKWGWICSSYIKSWRDITDYFEIYSLELN